MTLLLLALTPTLALAAILALTVAYIEMACGDLRGRDGALAVGGLAGVGSIVAAGAMLGRLAGV